MTDAKVFSLSEVKKHNTEKDCWIIINNKVYDVTKFLDEHPGGDTVIVENAGGFATEAFEDVGHSESARKQMEQYCIGALDENDKESTLKFSSNYSRDRAPGFSNKWIDFAVPATILIAGAYALRRYLRRH